MKELLFNRLPPDVQQSTPLAEAPIRATCRVLVDATGEMRMENNNHGQDQLLAGTMTTVARSATESPSEAIPPHDGSQLHTVVSPNSHSTPTSTASNPAFPEATATNESTSPRMVEMLKCHPPWYEYEPTAAMFKIVTDDTHPRRPSSTLLRTCSGLPLSLLHQVRSLDSFTSHSKTVRPFVYLHSLL